MNSASHDTASDGSMSKTSSTEPSLGSGRLLQLVYNTTVWDAYVKNDELFICDIIYVTTSQIECVLIIAAEHDYIDDYIDTEYVKCLTTQGIGWVAHNDLCDV